MVFRECLILPEPTALMRPENQALYLLLLSDIWRFDDPDNPLAYGHRENVLEHTLSCAERIERYMTDCPQVVHEFSARYPDYGVEQDIVDMIFIHEAGEYFAGDVPKTDSRKMALKEQIKDKEHLAFDQFVLPQFAPHERARIHDLYWRFERSSSSDILAQVARLIDNEDGNSTALQYRVMPNRQTRSPEETQREVSNSLNWFLTPAAHIFTHLTSEQARSQHLAYLRMNIQAFVEGGLEHEVAQAFLPSSSQAPKPWQEVFCQKLLPGQPIHTSRTQRLNSISAGIHS